MLVISATASDYSEESDEVMQVHQKLQRGLRQRAAGRGQTQMGLCCCLQPAAGARAGGGELGLPPLWLLRRPGNALSFQLDAC